jgi:hypothetical protein
MLEQKLCAHCKDPETPLTGVVSIAPGKEWRLELTFDDGKQGHSKDLGPDLPLVIRY